MSHGSIERLKEIRDTRQQQLKDAAIELFGMKGYAATKISEITDKAKLSHGLFYHYFKSKEDLYVQLIHELVDIVLDTIDDAEQKHKSPLKQLERLTEVTHSGSLRDGVHRHILIMQALYSDHLPQEVKLGIVNKYRTIMDRIAVIIEKGQIAGEFIDGDPEELAVYHVSLVHGLLLSNARKLVPIDVSASKVLRQLMRSPEQGG
ncbi:TetR/AcrR family transcriptional regulator [Sporosarcina sp. P33]|uniref:TetR/AcrR family transcriptional regulator n=1 Tax=Sporosarcina sp. P33 TaxID=1930764 RepID=UPI0009C12D10|nr:TetR/AcrR family transcriptional regulator [Sporosarcina sp. P33]ARD47391.1 hypothetical protein SporoP33_03400 [Sporosarcina sp. P33]